VSTFSEDHDLKGGIEEPAEWPLIEINVPLHRTVQPGSGEST
jgi:hypothetical protein